MTRYNQILYSGPEFFPYSIFIFLFQPKLPLYDLQLLLEKEFFLLFVDFFLNLST